MRAYLVHTAEEQRSSWKRGIRKWQTWEMGLGPPGSEHVLSWVTAHHLSAGSRGLGGLVVQTEQLLEMGAVLRVRGVLLGSHRVQKMERTQRHQAKRPLCWGFVTINSIEWMEISWSREIYPKLQLQLCTCLFLWNDNSSATSQGLCVV